MVWVILFLGAVVAGLGLVAAGLRFWFIASWRRDDINTRAPRRSSRVARVVLCVLGTLACLAGAPLLWLAWERSRLPYNELGRHYDAEQGIVYVDNAVPVYTLIGGCMLAFGLANFALARFRRQAR